jgi:hypothetical protein
VHRARDTSAHCRTKTLATFSTIANLSASLNRIRRCHRILALADTDVRRGIRSLVALRRGLGGGRGKFCVEGTTFGSALPRTWTTLLQLQHITPWSEFGLKTRLRVLVLFITAGCAGSMSLHAPIGYQYGSKSMWLLMLMRRILYMSLACKA